MSSNTGFLRAGNQTGRPASNQNVYAGYEATASPINYNSPGQASVLSRISKTTTSPPTTQSAWTNLRQVLSSQPYDITELLFILIANNNN